MRIIRGWPRMACVDESHYWSGEGERQHWCFLALRGHLPPDQPSFHTHPTPSPATAQLHAASHLAGHISVRITDHKPVNLLAVSNLSIYLFPLHPQDNGHEWILQIRWGYPKLPN